MPYFGNQHIVGDSVNNFKVLDDISTYTETFDGSASSVVSTSAETIKVINHRFIQGQRVTYNNGGGSNIGGLTSGTAYYVIYDTAHTIKLATSALNAGSLTAINLNAVGGGASHTLNASFDGVNKRFRITHGGGNRARFSQATQLSIAINNVIQKPNNDPNNFSEGYAIEIRNIIVFQNAPTSNDIFFGSLLGETLGTFDITNHKIDTYTGDGSTTIFNLSQNVPNNESLLVSLNGVIQHPSSGGVTRAYGLLSGTTNRLQFTAAPEIGVEIQIRHLGFAGANISDVTGFYGRTGNVGLTTGDHITTGDITSRNINSSGIITASSFIGDGSGLIGVASTDNIITGTAATFNTYPVDINAGMTVAGVSTMAAITATTGTFSGAISGTSATFSGDVSIGGTITYEDLINVDSVGLATFREGIFLPDNKKLEIGNASGSGDLQLYHDTNHSYIDDAGTGNLKLRSGTIEVSNLAGSKTSAVFNSGSSQDLYFNNDKKFETSEKGIKIGAGVTIETNGQATFVGVVTFGSSSTTIDGDANTIKVGTALTLGHTQGLQFHTQNLHSAGFEINNINASGIITATQFKGDGSNLTGLASREFYGFTGIGNSLSLTTTNSGADNIDGATYAAFEDSFTGPSGISFSINTSGNLIMSV